MTSDVTELTGSIEVSFYRHFRVFDDTYCTSTQNVKRTKLTEQAIDGVIIQLPQLAHFVARMWLSCEAHNVDHGVDSGVDYDFDAITERSPLHVDDGDYSGHSRRHFSSRVRRSALRYPGS